MSVQTTIWNGTTDTSFDTTTNWSTAAKLGADSVTGTAQAGGASTITLASGDSAANNAYAGYVIFTTGGTGPGQWRLIVSNMNSSKVAMVTPSWTVNPDSSTTYAIGDIGYFTAIALNAAATDLASQSSSFASVINVGNAFTNGIGNVSGTDTYLAMNVGIINIGLASLANSQGSRQLNFNLGSTYGTLINLIASLNGGTSNQPCVRILGTNLVINQQGGQLGVAYSPSESASVASLVQQSGTFVSGPNTVFGAGGITLNGGTANYAGNSTIPQVIVNGGVYTNSNEGIHTSLTINTNATAYYNGAGTITTLVPYGTLDLSGGAGIVNVTNVVNFNRGAKVNDPLGRLKFLAGYTTLNCSATDVGINLGNNRMYTVA